MPTLPTCLSYFEETSNPAVEAAHARERAKWHAKQRQLKLAAELSDVTSDEYRDDILDTMEELEVRHLMVLTSIHLLI